MKKKMVRGMFGAFFTFILSTFWVGSVLAAPLPGGMLDPLLIPKYVTPLVIPPQMPKSPVASQFQDPPADHNIAVRQFQQQILPAGFPPTTVWSYGRAEDVIPPGFIAPAPLEDGVSFNYPAYTIEAMYNVPLSIRWINDLVDANGNYLPHLFPVDQTLHWANPAATGCADGTDRTDCRTLDPTNYTGPVPMVTHVHGAHVNSESDGYPEAWWLPAANNIPTGYATEGTIFSEYDATNAVPGSAYYAYENDQPAATLWYHDHTLGITRLNVYAGPAGFYLVRGGAYDDATDGVGGGTAVLPGPAPVDGSGDPNFDPAYRAILRDIPVVIQGRSFNADGSLFYPSSRAFFDGYLGPYVPTSDISPSWNPEAFFNTMVVNGSTWPVYEVAPAKYRLRLLNGTNSRFLNLSLFEVIKDVGNGKKQKDMAKFGAEFPFYQIGAEQGFLPQVVQIQTGFATPLPGDGTLPAVLTPAPDPMQALLLGPAERADVIVDFSNLPDGTVIRMLNTAPDAPFGGFPDVPADPWTTGQVMQFVVNSTLTKASDAATTPPQNLVLNSEPGYPDLLAGVDTTRPLSLNEEESQQVCVQVTPSGNIRVLLTLPFPDPNIVQVCAAVGGVPMAPKAALLGTATNIGGALVGNPLMWASDITENPQVGDDEIWEINNFTVDGHPIHLHLVRFQVVNRQLLDPVTFLPVGPTIPPQPSELGWKDTVVALPGQVTRIRANFDREGLYVWHCHILEHEDNEMMRPYFVGDINNSPVQ